MIVLHHLTDGVQVIPQQLLNEPIFKSAKGIRAAIDLLADDLWCRHGPYPQMTVHGEDVARASRKEMVHIEKDALFRVGFENILQPDEGCRVIEAIVEFTLTASVVWGVAHIVGHQFDVRVVVVQGINGPNDIITLQRHAVVYRDEDVKVTMTLKEEVQMILERRTEVMHVGTIGKALHRLVP